VGITKQDLIDIISSQVQTVIMEKVQSFTDGWAVEFQKLVVQVMRTEEHNSLIISRMNALEHTGEKIKSIEDKLGQLVAVFEKGGLADRSNGMLKQFQEFLEKRAETCPMNRQQRKWLPLVVALCAQIPVWIVLFMRLKLI
jgi:hypothetical protein